MVFEQIMSVEEYVVYDIMSALDTLRRNRIDKFYDLKYRCELDGDHPYVVVWTKSEEERLVILYCNPANTLMLGYPEDSYAMNAVANEPVFKRFLMATIKPPVLLPENMVAWQHKLYGLIQKEVSKHVTGVLRDEIRREILTTIEL